MRGFSDLDSHFTVIADRLSGWLRVVRERDADLTQEMSRKRRRAKHPPTNQELATSLRFLDVRLERRAAASAIRHLATAWALWRRLVARRRHEIPAKPGFCLQVTATGSRAIRWTSGGEEFIDEAVNLEISRAPYAAGCDLEGACGCNVRVTELLDVPERAGVLVELHVRHECVAQAGDDCQVKLLEGLFTAWHRGGFDAEPGLEFEITTCAPTGEWA